MSSAILLPIVFFLSSLGTQKSTAATGEEFSQHLSPIVHVSRGNISRKGKSSLQQNAAPGQHTPWQSCFTSRTLHIVTSEEEEILIGYLFLVHVEESTWMAWESPSTAIPAAPALGPMLSPPPKRSNLFAQFLQKLVECLPG